MNSASLFVLLAVTTATSFAQGPLNLPGAPAPAMKSLDQIEARTDVLKLAAAPPYTITQPGSYYLTGNITVSSGSAIVITAASDVSIDLNGFTIASTLTGSANGYGIQVASAGEPLAGDRSAGEPARHLP
jgi:hypothetical protein